MVCVENIKPRGEELVTGVNTAELAGGRVFRVRQVSASKGDECLHVLPTCLS